MCSYLDLVSYQQGKGNKRHLNVRSKGLCAHGRVTCVSAVTSLCIDGLLYYLEYLLSLMRRFALTLSWVHTVKIKVSCDF